MPDIWNWLQQYERNLLSTGTQAHYDLLELYHRATFLGSASSHLALPVLREARRHADELGETCFSLFLAHWITENLLWHTRNYTEALENALGAVLTLRTLPGKICPLEDRLHINLVEVYTEVDPGGYQREIEDNLAYVKVNVDLDYESHCMMAFRQGLMHARLGEWDAARTAANQCLAEVERASGADYYRAVAQFVLGVVAFKNGDAETLLKLAEAGEKTTRTGVPAVYKAEFMLWQAWALRHLGDDAAEYRLRDAIASGQRDPEAMSFAYYDALVGWFLTHDQVSDALKVREAQRDIIAGRGRALDEAEMWLDLIALHKKANHPTAETAEAARTAISKLRQPQPYLDKLAMLLEE